MPYFSTKKDVVSVSIRFVFSSERYSWVVSNLCSGSNDTTREYFLAFLFRTRQISSGSRKVCFEYVLNMVLSENNKLLNS